MTSQLESLKRQEKHFVPSSFEAENWWFPASFSYKEFLQRSKKYDFCDPFSRHSQNAAPATTFDTVSCLRSSGSDSAIYESNTFATWEKCCSYHENRRRSSTKCCACHVETTPCSRHVSKALLAPATRNANAIVTYATQRNKTMLFAVLFAVKSTSNRSLCHIFVSAVQRWGLATSSRTVANVKTTLGEHDSNLQTSRVQREPFASIREKKEMAEVECIPIVPKNPAYFISL